MAKSKTSCRQIVFQHAFARSVTSWVASAGLILALIVLVSASLAAHAQQSQAEPQPGQTGDWGQAGPPPDATNGQIPPPPAENSQPSADQQNAPPAAQNGAAPPPPLPPQVGPGAPEYSPGYGNGEQGRAPYQPRAAQPYPYQDENQAQAAPPSGPVTVAPGTLLQVRTSEPLDVKKLQPGDYFQATVAQSVYVGNVLAIPRGAQVIGRVVDVKKSGELKGSPALTLEVTSLKQGGQSYALASDTWSATGPGKGGYTAGNTVGGAALGAVIGAIAGGGPGAAIGAVAGTGVGLGASAATSGPRVAIRPESVLAFHLTKPVTVQPVSYQEARELAQDSPPPPSRYAARPGYPYPPAAPYSYYAAPYPYPYAYPYPYVYAYPYPYRYGPYYRYRYWR